MIKLQRADENPIISPSSNDWEKRAAFNGCVVENNGNFYIVYRAVSEPQSYYRGANMEISSIGLAKSPDGIHFENRMQFIKPQNDWEIFGCEDPRITKINDKFYIFYTALSTYPFSPLGIKIGVAITSDLKTVSAKYPVTPFNAKAMALFPEKVNGKLAAILTINTDIPPAKIAISFFDKEEDIWSKDFWLEWYSSHDSHVIPLLRNFHDQIEVGAPPIKTEKGWLLIYSYIRNYYSSQRIFGIETVLLDLNDPTKIISRTEDPILLPDRDYELYGTVPNVVFPSGALVKDEMLYVYYGAADTTCCLATCNLSELLDELTSPQIEKTEPNSEKFTRFEGNPIISPIPEHPWEARSTFNPAAIHEEGKIHLLYRAMSQDNTSVIGYASSTDGFKIDERLTHPIYTPRENFERKMVAGGNSGCEDPRLTKIDGRIYMCYTAYNGNDPPRVALTSIDTHDFFEKHWNWDKTKIISPSNTDDKDACMLSKKIDGKYVFFHRINNDIWIDFIENLEFSDGKFLDGEILLKVRPGKWDNQKIGIAAPPIETERGWLLIYHGITDPGIIYKVGAVLLDLDNPRKILKRLEDPILEPEMTYEKEGEVKNVVFPCGAVVKNGEILIYYGGGDRVVGVASINLEKLLEKLQ
ncbi:MAG: hypothetical protein HYT08_03830 [Candidatus Levybacteria bacterium]|nr:hypothetical protein [Candidatus Levybacteria bacterium]